MSAIVMVNMSGPKNQKLFRSRFQCTHAPMSERPKKMTASVVCSGAYAPRASRNHCHLK